MRKWHREWILDLYILLLALLLFVHPWLFTRASETAAIDLWASSATIVVTSLAAIVAYANWKEWINLVLAVWLIASPWVLGFTHTSAMHFSIGVGAVVAFLAALELWLNYEAASGGFSQSNLSQEH